MHEPHLPRGPIAQQPGPTAGVGEPVAAAVRHRNAQQAAVDDGVGLQGRVEAGHLLQQLTPCAGSRNSWTEPQAVQRFWAVQVAQGCQGSVSPPSRRSMSAFRKSARGACCPSTSPPTRERRFRSMSRKRDSAGCLSNSNSSRSAVVSQVSCGWVSTHSRSLPLLTATKCTRSLGKWGW